MELYMFNGQCIITSTNLPLPHLLCFHFCSSSLPCPLLPLFLSQIIYSNPLVMMMVVPVAVMQITAVWEGGGLQGLSMSCHSFLTLLYSIIAGLHYIKDYPFFTFSSLMPSPVSPHFTSPRGLHINLICVCIFSQDKNF